MLVSIIIPSYKPEKWIWKCLDSIKEQTLSKNLFEIIIVLNGCNEPYQTQIKKFINLSLYDYNVILVQTDKGGVSNARNIGLNISSGEYITFIDDDDYISSTFLDELLKESINNDIIISNTFSFDDVTGQIDENYDIHLAFNKLCHEVKTINNTRKFFSGPVMKLIHKSVLEGFTFDESFKNGEDSLFMFLISKNIKHIGQSSSFAIYFRRNRVGSAVSRMLSRKYVLQNRIKLIYEYTKIYFGDFGKYDTCFYMTRILASIKVIIQSIK
ncbi:glycosyltransferase family 2 protein [Bacteroides sp.]|uniref:glycosyltransferase family 2 protein n=1 Tax=Bacteroides sp. TaxID=29523 RepID=UPI0026240A3E|nr:glycosyltransferase family 2 protein [Bacteroides sp.]MDD3038172.1 glycosyltransferase family 2 protein [Bacteroides sp.]